MARGKKETEEPGEEVQRPGVKGFGFLVLANAYRRAAEYGQARRVCFEGLKHHPDYLSARMALAVILLESGETEAAQAELETVIEAAPSNILARRLLGNLYQEAGNAAEARKQFEEILWLFPDHEETLKSLVELDEKAASAESGGAPPAETHEETVVDEEPATVEAPPEEESAAKSPMETVSEESPFSELADRDESEPLDTRVLAGLYEEQGHREDSLIAEEEKEEEPPAAEEKPLGQAGKGSPEAEEASVDLGPLDPGDLEREDPAEIKKTPSEESPDWRSELEDICSDLGAKPDLEEETRAEDQEPYHAPVQGDISTSSVSAVHGGPEEPAPDESASDREEAIDRLENLLQKIQTKKNAPP